MHHHTHISLQIHKFTVIEACPLNKNKQNKNLNVCCKIDYFKIHSSNKFFICTKTTVIPVSVSLNLIERVCERASKKPTSWTSNRCFPFRRWRVIMFNFRPRAHALSTTSSLVHNKPVRTLYLACSVILKWMISGPLEN